VWLQELWNGHLDWRGRTSRHPYQLKYQRWKLISTPECIHHCLAPPGVFKMMQHYDTSATAQDRRPARLGSLSSAGFSWQGSKIRDWTSHRLSEWSSLGFSTVRVGNTPCKAERQRSATAIGGKPNALEIAAGGSSHHRRRHRGVQTLETLFHTYGAAHPFVQQDLVQRNRYSDAIRCAGLATTLRVMGLEFCQRKDRTTA
jgi:hypothetical protein